MDGDQGLATETLFDLAFDGRYLLMRGAQRKVSVHADVALDGNAVPDVAGTKVVGLGNAVERCNDIDDFAFLLCRQGLSVNSPKLPFNRSQATFMSIPPTTIDASGSSTAQRSPSRMAPPMPIAAPMEESASLR